MHMCTDIALCSYPHRYGYAHEQIDRDMYRFVCTYKYIYILLIRSLIGATAQQLSQTAECPTGRVGVADLRKEDTWRT